LFWKRASLEKSLKVGKKKLYGKASKGRDGGKKKGAWKVRSDSEKLGATGTRGQSDVGRVAGETTGGEN